MAGQLRLLAAQSLVMVVLDASCLVPLVVTAVIPWKTRATVQLVLASVGKLLAGRI